MAGLKLNQHVDVAVRTKIVAQDRAEQRQARDVMSSAERRHGLTIDRNVWGSSWPAASMIRASARAATTSRATASA